MCPWSTDLKDGGCYIPLDIVSFLVIGHNHPSQSGFRVHVRSLRDHVRSETTFSPRPRSLHQAEGVDVTSKPPMWKDRQ